MDSVPETADVNSILVLLHILGSALVWTGAVTAPSPLP
jgi:hypothetical protein